MSSAHLSLTASLSGFLLGLSLIFSIGPQNLQLIRAGAFRQRPAIVATTGYLSEIVIVLVGVHGVAGQLETAPQLAEIMRGCGIAFLAWNGLKSMLLTRKLKQATAGPVPGPAVHHAVVAMLAVTWLNPLVYIEVMFLVGLMSSTFGDVARLWFALGFLMASAIRFYGWSLAGRLLTGWLSSPVRQRRFDVISGILLLVSAILLTIQMAR
jgi:L-lysine exporter family protein LysE/ArgO